MDCITPMLEKKLRFRCLNCLTNIIKLVVSAICLFLFIFISDPFYITQGWFLQATLLKFCLQTAFSQWNIWQVIREWQKGEANVSYPPLLWAVSPEVNTSPVILTSPLVAQLPQGSLRYGSSSYKVAPTPWFYTHLIPLTLQP